MECLRGDEQQVQRRLVLLADASVLPLTESIMELVARLVVPGGLPRARLPTRCTWPPRIIEEHGYERPIVCTPEELFGVDAVEG